MVSLYVLTGISQPLLLTACQLQGLTNPHAQLYMVFYYAGPSLLLYSVRDWTNVRPQAVLRAAGICATDIVAQALNYTGAAWAGSTLFAVIYSSVTVWTAVWSRLFLQRRLIWQQWAAVFVVFCGLTITAWDSTSLGPAVQRGALCVVIGSALHAACYVWSEAIMGSTTHALTIQQNAAVQSIMAMSVFGAWQVIYTIPNWNEAVEIPMREAGGSWQGGLIVLAAFGLANLLHAWAFYYTLHHCPGGSTSAGVLKGLQAVLVFVATHFLFCGRPHTGQELCFTLRKMWALITVVCGVGLFGYFTRPPRENGYTTVPAANSKDVDKLSQLA